MALLELFLQVLLQFGFPTAALIVVGVYHVKIVAKKDATIAAMSIRHEEVSRENAQKKDEEIKRINEARIVDAQKSHDRAVKIATEFTELTAETNSTLKLLTAASTTTTPKRPAK